MLRIGMIGAAGSGKDSLCEAMQRIDPTLGRVAFGDTVKACAGPLLAIHGVAVTSMTRDEKNSHRPLLERLGDLSLELAGEQWLQTLPDRCINTRIQRATEALAWLNAGGVLLEVQRTDPATETERQYLAEMLELPHRTVANVGTLDDLHGIAQYLIQGRR